MVFRNYLIENDILRKIGKIIVQFVKLWIITELIKILDLLFTFCFARKKSCRIFFFNAARPIFSPKISTDFPQSQKKWLFSGRVFHVDLEYMLNVANGPILA
jgi:hypothetical protein